MIGEATQHSKGRTLGLLRAVALIALTLGALGSFVLMLSVGHYSFSILMVLFTIWDLSPFLALIVVDFTSKHWPVFSRAALYGVMLIVAAGSVAIYGTVALKAPAQPAFAFLMVPLGSWVLLIVVVLVAHVVSTKVSGRHERLFRS
jgi:hypothetical protein